MKDLYKLVRDYKDICNSKSPIKAIKRYNILRDIHTIVYYGDLEEVFRSLRTIYISIMRNSKLNGNIEVDRGDSVSISITVKYRLKVTIIFNNDWRSNYSNNSSASETITNISGYTTHFDRITDIYDEVIRPAIYNEILDMLERSR